MYMDYFQKLAMVMSEGTELNMSVLKLPNDTGMKVSVSIVPVKGLAPEKFKDITPMNMVASADQIDENFFEIFSEPVQKITEAMTNTAEYVKAVTKEINDQKKKSAPKSSTKVTTASKKEEPPKERKASTKDGETKRAEAQLQQQKDRLVLANDLIKEGKYDEAMAELRGIRAPKDPAVIKGKEETMKDLETKRAAAQISEAQELLKAGSLEQAKDLLKEIKTDYADKSVIDGMLNQIKSIQYTAQIKPIVESIMGHLDSLNFPEAIETMKKAMSVVPNHPLYKQIKEKIINNTGGTDAFWNQMCDGNDIPRDLGDFVKENPEPTNEEKAQEPEGSDPDAENESLAAEEDQNQPEENETTE